MNTEKTEVNGIVRDMSSGALLSVDDDSLTAYKKKKKMNQDLKSLKEKVYKIDKLESEINEIKSLLKTIAEKI